MSTQRGVEGDVAWFLEGADEVARIKNRLQHCGGVAGICPQVAVEQTGCGEKCSAASEIQNNIAARSSVIARWPEQQCAAPRWRRLREIVDRDLERAEMTPGISDLYFRHWEIVYSRRRDVRGRFDQHGDVKMVFEEIAGFDGNFVAAADENAAAAFQFD